MLSDVRGGVARASVVAVAQVQPPLGRTTDAVGRPISAGFYNLQTSLLQGVHQPPPAPFKNFSGVRTAPVDHHEQFVPNGHTTITTHAQDALPPPPRTRIDVQASTTRREQRARKRDLVLDQLRQQADELRRRDRLLWTLLEERLAASQRIQALLLDKKNYVGGVGTTTARGRRKVDKRGTSFAEDEDDTNCGAGYMMEDYTDDQVVLEDGSSGPWDHDQQGSRGGENHSHLNHRHRAGAMRPRPHDPAPIDTATQIRTRTAAGTRSFLPYLRNLIQSAGSTDVATFEALFDATLDESVVDVDRDEPQPDQRSYLNIGENDLKSSTCLSSAIFDFDEAFL